MKKKFSKKIQNVDLENYIEDFYNGEISFDVKEAYKMVRTNIMFATSAVSGCKKLIITSSVPGEGKSTTCINLAISTVQAGSKVLIIDADLRKPTIHKFLKLDHSLGLSSVLSGFNTFEEVVVSTKFGFDCVTSGIIPPNPAELLMNDKLEQLINWASERYDYIIIDTPPINIVTDSSIISKYVDGTILVTRNKYTVHPSVEYAIKTLEFAGAKILGFILNDKTTNVRKDYCSYKYGRGYGYRYGYSYTQNKSSK